MDLGAFVPPTGVASSVALLSIARFEAQRWGRVRNAAIRGSSEAPGFLVGATFNIATIFVLVSFFAFLWDYGWQPTITIVAISLLASTVWRMFMPDNFLVWVISTVACWVLMVILGAQVSWFGFFS